MFFIARFWTQPNNFCNKLRMLVSFHIDFHYNFYIFAFSSPFLCVNVYYSFFRFFCCCLYKIRKCMDHFNINSFWKQWLLTNTENVIDIHCMAVSTCDRCKTKIKRAKIDRRNE